MRVAWPKWSDARWDAPASREKWKLSRARACERLNRRGWQDESLARWRESSPLQVSVATGRPWWKVCRRFPYLRGLQWVGAAIVR